MGYSQVVRHWTLTPTSVGSNPTTPAKRNQEPSALFLLAEIVGVGSRPQEIYNRLFDPYSFAYSSASPSANEIYSLRSYRQLATTIKIMA